METAAIKIQAVVRGYMTRRCLYCGRRKHPEQEKPFFINKDWYKRMCHDCAADYWNERYESKHRVWDEYY